MFVLNMWLDLCISVSRRVSLSFTMQSVSVSLRLCVSLSLSLSLSLYLYLYLSIYIPPLSPPSLSLTMSGYLSKNAATASGPSWIAVAIGVYLKSCSGVFRAYNRVCTIGCLEVRSTCTYDVYTCKTGVHTSRCKYGNGGGV